MTLLRCFFWTLVLTAFTLTSQAQDTDRGGYIGLGGGGAKYNGFNELCRDLSEVAGEELLDSSCDSSETVFGWKLFGGYRFNRYLGLEAGYANLGEASDETDIGDTTVSGNISSTALFGTLVGYLPLGSQARLLAKLGVTNIEAKLKSDAFDTFGASTPSISQDSTEALYGVGFEYRFSPKIAGRLEWERFDFEDGIDLYSLGIVFFPGKQ